MAINQESLRRALQNDLDELDGVSADLWVVAHNVVKTGKGRLITHGPSIVDAVVDVCCQWWRENPPPHSSIDAHSFITPAIAADLREFAKRREAMS